LLRNVLPWAIFLRSLRELFDAVSEGRKALRTAGPETGGTIAADPTARFSASLRYDSEPNSRAIFDEP